MTVTNYILRANLGRSNLYIKLVSCNNHLLMAVSCLCRHLLKPVINIDQLLIVSFKYRSDVYCQI